MVVEVKAIGILLPRVTDYNHGGKMILPDFFAPTGAIYSECEGDPALCASHRYLLWRTWDERPMLMVIALNPSTATEHNSDPTVTRLIERARMGGHGGLIVANIFAYRSPLPKVMRAHPDPIGPLNDAYILHAARDARDHGGRIVCAWGGHGGYMNRGPLVEHMLRAEGFVLHALRLNADGTPQHPLYIPYEVTPHPWFKNAVQ